MTQQIPANENTGPAVPAETVAAQTPAARALPSNGSTIARMLWGFVGVTVGWLIGAFLIFGLQAELSEEIAQALAETTFFPIIGALFTGLLAIVFGVLVSWAGERWYRVVSKKRALARAGRPY